MRLWLFTGISLVGLLSTALPQEFGNAVPTKGQKQEPLPGTIVGIIRFTGKVPEPKTIPVSDGSTIKHSDLVVDAKTKGLRDVLAVLEGAPAQHKIKDAKPVLIDQVGFVFKPRLVAVRHGQPVRFENNDAVNQSVMASSTVSDNQFNSIAGPGTPITRVFKPQKPPVLIGCSLHPWMRAWVYVIEHPWFGVSDKRGEFRIEQVPPGKHTVLLVHADTNLRERRAIEIQPGKTARMTVEWQKVK